MYRIYRYIVPLFLCVALQAEFASVDLNLSGLSSLSKMGKKMERLPDLNLSGLSSMDFVIFKANKEENGTEESLRPYLNEGTKALEREYPWLYEEMQGMLLNEENAEAYAAESAYFKVLDDLNGDGIAEIYLHSQARCGASICSYRVYQIDAKRRKLRQIFDEYNDAGATVIGKEDANGWKSIFLMQCWGAASCHCYRFGYDTQSRQYEMQREISCKDNNSTKED